jgi:rRNA maturation endonuclease Nob1
MREPPLCKEDGMSVRKRLARLIGDTQEQTHCECRRCGRNLECTQSPCPECGGPTVTYEF